MIERNTTQGLFLILISLVFGLQSLHYSMGEIDAAGPGLFPLIVSILLFVVGVSTVVRARFTAKQPLRIDLKNIAIILGSLVIFGIVSEYVNMICGIIVMVFCASIAAVKYSVIRNVQIAVALIVIALMFQKLLGLELPLY
jgi:NADH:ubiquinone oxidoreductase subunit K